MMRGILFGTVALLATSALAAEAGQDDVKAAAKKLADADSYSWKQNTENAGGGGGGRGGGPTEGKTEKDGYTYLKMTRGNNTVEVVMKGDKAAIKTEDGWKTTEEAAQDNGGGQPNPARFLSRMLRNFKGPAAQAQDLADKVKELAKSDDAYSGDLSEEGAKQLLMFGGGGRRGGGNANGNGNAPEISNAKGSVKFWTKDGTLSKYEYHVQGTISFNGNDRDVDRTTTVEISDVGSTKVDVPDEAKKKLS